MTKIPSISSIFEKILKENDNNGYSDDALLYQDILQYSIIKQKESRDEGFTLWEITNWLIKNNIEFVEYYNQIDKRTMNTSNKIRARIDRVEAKVKDLETLRLIDFIRKDPTQTGGSTSYYRNSDSGNILAWLIEYLKSEKKDIAVKTLYDIWIKNFEKIDSSLEKFMRIFFRKFYEQKVFEKFIICYLLRVINETYVKDWTNLLNYLTHPFDQTVEDLKLYMKIWEESIAELDEESRKMFLYRLKLDIEVKVESKVVNYKSYEEIRFEIRENHEQICVEGICESCNYSNIYKVNLIYFCKRVQIQWASPIYYDCQDCKEKKAKVATLEYTR